MTTEYQFQFTVCTPTYNCGKFIHRVISSLESQTFTDFEWVVIDDGSTDNTKSIVKKYIGSKPFFPIQYYHQENQGKPSAINRGVTLARGKLFVCADADDEFIPETLETFFSTWEQYGENNPKVSAICCNCKTQHGKLHGTEYPFSPWIADEFEMRFKYKVNGEKWHVVQTDIMKKFPWNTKVDKHVPPTHVWYAMANEYKAVFINKALRIYYIHQEGHESISSTKKIKYPAGRRFRDLEVINKYLTKVINHKKFVRTTFVNYIRMSIHAKVSIKRMFRDINSPTKQLLIFLLLPLGIRKALSDRIKGRI